MEVRFFFFPCSLYSVGEQRQGSYSSSDEYRSAVDHRIVGLRLSLDHFLGKEESISVG